MKRDYIFGVLAAVFCCCLIVSNIFETVIFSAGPLTLTGGFLIFPISYIINDCLSELYGYRSTRAVVLLAMALNLLTVLIAQLLMRFPSAGMVDSGEHFAAVFHADFRITVASACAFLMGSLLNARVMVSMKGHGGFCLRAVLSTLAGETMDSLVFFPIAFWHTGLKGILLLMVTQIILKTAYEVVLLPITSRLIRSLQKRI